MCTIPNETNRTPIELIFGGERVQFEVMRGQEASFNLASLIKWLPIRIHSDRDNSTSMTDTVSTDIIELTENVIDYAELTEGVRSHQAGAVILFLGTVREMTAGRKTLCLDYEAYPEMALAKLRELAVETRNRWPVDRLGIVHRLGHLELGEISVAVAVGCPHRRDAFEAGQYLIDRLKQVVPIWKKENWSDGSTEWVHPGSGSPIPLLNTEGAPSS